MAVPIMWDELDKLKVAHPYTIADAETLVERSKSKQLKGWGETDQTLPDL